MMGFSFPKDVDGYGIVPFKEEPVYMCCGMCIVSHGIRCDLCNTKTGGYPLCVICMEQVPDEEHGTRCKTCKELEFPADTITVRQTGNAAFFLDRNGKPFFAIRKMAGPRRQGDIAIAYAESRIKELETEVKSLKRTLEQFMETIEFAPQNVEAVEAVARLKKASLDLSK